MGSEERLDSLSFLKKIKKKMLTIFKVVIEFVTVLLLGFIFFYVLFWFFYWL